jgi:hypothetical protein
VTRQLSPPSCGEEELTGQRDEEGIQITCDRCGTSWLRDAAPLCVSCDADMLSRSLVGKPVPNNYRPAAMTRRDPGQDTDRHSVLPR